MGQIRHNRDNTDPKCVNLAQLYSRTTIELDKAETMISFTVAMSSLRQITSVLAVLAALVWAPLSAPAYEQSSYHVFDLVESGAEAGIDGRIALPEDVFAEETGPATAPAPIVVERSDFEIDLTRTIREEGPTSFTGGLSEFETNETAGTTDRVDESTGFGDSSFGTSTSVFSE